MSWREVFAVKSKKIELTPAEYKELDKRFGKDRECSFARDEDGYYCYTHRSRSKSYKSIADIPEKDYKFTCSTG